MTWPAVILPALAEASLPAEWAKIDVRFLNMGFFAYLVLIGIAPIEKWLHWFFFEIVLTFSPFENVIGHWVIKSLQGRARNKGVCSLKIVLLFPPFIKAVISTVGRKLLRGIGARSSLWEVFSSLSLVRNDMEWDWRLIISYIFPLLGESQEPGVRSQEWDGRIKRLKKVLLFPPLSKLSFRP